MCLYNIVNYHCHVANVIIWTNGGERFTMYLNRTNPAANDDLFRDNEYLLELNSEFVYFFNGGFRWLKRLHLSA